MTVYPAISSLVSVKGPSITVGVPAEKETRAALELGCSPSPSRSTPALPSSSMYACIEARSSVLGITPASVLLSALRMIMNRIVVSPCRRFDARWTGPYWDIDRAMAFFDIAGQAAWKRDPTASTSTR